MIHLDEVCQAFQLIQEDYFMFIYLTNDIYYDMIVCSESVGIEYFNNDILMI